jgi:predicted transcriptional regulator
MAEKRVSSVDMDTGEILDYSLVAMQHKIPNGFAGGWVAMAQGAMEMLAASDLRGDDLRVLLLLMARLDFENLISLEQTAVAEKLGMHKQHVSRSIKRLVSIGCLLEGPKIGRSRTYRLNPTYGWKGAGKNHQKALRTAEKAKAAGLSVVKGGQHQEAGGKPV